MVCKCVGWKTNSDEFLDICILAATSDNARFMAFL